MVRFKIDIIKALIDKGYNTSRIRREKLLSEGTLQRIRNNNGEPVTTATIDILCHLLRKQPGQLLEWIPDEKQPEPVPVLENQEEPPEEYQEITPTAADQGEKPAPSPVLKSIF